MRIFITILLVCAFGRGYAQDSVIVFHKLSSLPGTPRVESGYFVIDSSLYIIGGLDSGNVFKNEVWRYDVSSDSWHQMGNFPAGGVVTSNTFVINNMGYLCGGADSLAGYHYNAQVWQYNPATDAWLRKADFPTIMGAGAAFAYADRGYVGCTNGDNGKTLWQYDPTGDQWTEMDSLSGDGRYGTAVTVVDSFAYFIGGYYATHPYCSNEIWKYHILGNRWEQMNTYIPGPARGFSPIWSFDKNIVLAYGIKSDTVDFKLLDDRFYYSTINNSWHSIVFQNFIDSTADGISFIVGNTGYYFGGDKTVYPGYSFYNDLWSFDATPLITGVSEVKTAPSFRLYPNPVSRDQGFSIASDEIGEVSFYDALGRLLDERRLVRGVNAIQLHTDCEVVIYRATLHDGSSVNGRVLRY